MKTSTTPIKTLSGELVKSRMAPIKNGRGDITGYIKLFWSNSCGWVSIPGAR